MHGRPDAQTFGCSILSFFNELGRKARLRTGGVRSGGGLGWTCMWARTRTQTWTRTGTRTCMDTDADLRGRGRGRSHGGVGVCIRVSLCVCPRLHRDLTPPLPAPPFTRAHSMLAATAGWPLLQSPEAPLAGCGGHHKSSDERTGQVFKFLAM